MSPRATTRLVIFAIALVISLVLRHPRGGSPSPVSATTTDSRATSTQVGPASETWGHLDSLPDHFARHGGDFHARDAEDYAAQAAALLVRAKAEGLPVKRDTDGSLRVYDPATGAFGAYSANGKTRTYFKPGSPDYFERQPGVKVDLRTEK